MTGCVVSVALLAPPTGCWLMTSCVAAPAVTVALKVTGLPLGTLADAVTVLVPGVLPRVQLVRVATPAPSVLMTAGLAGLIEPPPAVRVKVTATPAFGLPLASVSFTDGAALTALPAVAF